jgi:mRNA deadenylase, exonuclease subunit and related nucleases
VEVFDRAEQKAIFVEYGSPDLTEELDHVYKCSSCGQGYWWSSSPNSSASRVKDACTHLLKLCLRGGVQVEGQPEFFSHVNYEEERNRGRIERMKNLSRTKYHPGAIEEVLGWLKTESLRNPFDLKSSYATEKDGAGDGELLPFTNVTSDFVGALDYIFFEKEKLRQVGRFTVPKSFAKLNSESEHNGHLLPSKYWPSDHLCIGAKFSFAYSFDKNDSSQITSAFVPSGLPAHLSPQLGCNCGCVPKVLSLFQMAELRKQAKLKKASEKRS